MKNPIAKMALFVYSYLFIPIVLILLPIFSLFSKKLREGFFGRLRQSANKQNSGSSDNKRIWFHCASVGEYEQTLIHPKTIAVANEIFAPSPDEVEWSKKIIAAHGEAGAAGKGVVVVDGKLIENLHVEAARRLVVLADAIAARDV